MKKLFFDELVDPYVFVRSVSLVLATVWSVLGLLRLLRFGRRWERRLAALGLPDLWVRKQMVIMGLRATVFDPINVGMMCLLIGIWTLPR